MIYLNFACKVVPLDKIMRCSFGLNKTEIAIMMYLVKMNKDMTVENIMKGISKDKTTIQRAVKSLSNKELVQRHQINLEKGGYVFVYKGASKNYIKERIQKNFEAFRDAIGREIEKW